MINFRNTRFIKSAISSEDSLFDMDHIVTIALHGWCFPKELHDWWVWENQTKFD